MNRSQLVQLALTALTTAILLAVAVPVSATIRRSEPPKHYVIVVTRVSCMGFDTQGQAQALYAAIPGDPFGLDKDGDGVACENLPLR